ncbi:MAG TPA: M20/M25/M40 family metallo-hydrolase [Longimicrobiales bacterium]|nr:M20/M25/M40 family metallo-hydrolase [Longimicrobiales bacterium]
MSNEPRSRIETAARSGDPVALAQLLVSTPSVNPALSPGGAGEGAIAELTAGLLEGWGLRAEVNAVAPAGRCNVVATLEGEGPTLMLNGHLDTVGVEGMAVPPFAAEIVASRLIGRGACDMKGGLAALLAASSRLAARGPRPNLVVALTADEEHASLGMQAIVRDGPPADLAVVCEPTSLAVMPAHKGFVWVRATFRGRAAHGSRPELGVDAIRHAALYVAALDRYVYELRARTRHPLLGHGSLHTGTITGGTAPSIYPDHCEVQLECRTLPGTGATEVVEEMQRVLDALAAREPSLDASLETVLERPGTEVPGDSGLVQGLLAAARAHELAPAVSGMTAWVDAALLNEAGTPAVCFGPGATEQAHTADEWIDTREIVTCADVLESFARGLAR